MPEKLHHYKDKFAEHEHRPDVAGEHPLGDLFQGIFFLVFLAAIIIDRMTIKTYALISPYLPLWIRIIASILILWIAWMLAKSGLKVVFGEIREKPSVINEGVFSLIRHPIYLGSILMYLAALVLTLSLVAGALWIIIILYYHYLALYEEKLLINKFGDAYKRYKQQVPMWIPRIRATKSVN
jgi:protein-S-isoprenylcysteine O-methyltransferase Ste14